ncbi:MAG: hypothetical protein ABR979_02590 [Halobacteriota archaeon]
MCTHDAEKLAISVLEIYDDGYRGSEVFEQIEWEAESCPNVDINFFKSRLRIGEQKVVLYAKV